MLLDICIEKISSKLLEYNIIKAHKLKITFTSNHIINFENIPKCENYYSIVLGNGLLLI